MSTKKVTGHSKILGALYNSEHWEFFDSFFEEAGEALHSVPELQDTVAELETLVEREDIIYKQDPQSYLTPEIAEADGIRDGLLKELKRQIDFIADNPDDTVNAPGKALLEVFHNYQNVTTENYYAETGDIKSMVQQFKEPRFSVLTAQLGLDELILKLKAANLEFERLYILRMERIEYFKSLGTSKDIRKEVDKVFTRLTEDINTSYTYLVKMFPASPHIAALEKIIDFINASLRQLSGVLGRRGRKVSGGKSKPTPPGTDLPPAPGEDGSGSGGGPQTPDITNPPAPFE